MNNFKNFSYILLPLFIAFISPAFAEDDAIIIAETDANVEVPVQNESADSSEADVKNNSKTEEKSDTASFETSSKTNETVEEKNTTDEITLENKGQKLEKRDVKKDKKKKNDYSEYLIPEDGYQTVGNTEDKQIYIQGAVSKTEELTLADCLELALSNNPKIKSAYANVAKVKESKVQTLSNYSPTISTNTSLTRNKMDTSGFPAGFNVSPYTRYLLGTISLSQLVYDFGVTQNQYTINKLDWEMSKQNVESVVNQVVCDVKDAYYNLLYALSTKQVRQETVEQYQQMYDQAKAFYEIGTRPRVDVTIASSNLADARANFIEASNAVDLAVSKLNNVMGTPFIDPYVVDTSMPYQPTDITMKQAIEIANKARPDLKTALYQIQRAEQNVKLYKKSYMPSLSVGANLSMGGRHNFVDNTWYDFGGYFSFPIINPVLITSQIKQAKAELEQQKFDTKNSVNDIYYEIQSAFVRVTDTSQRIVASKLAVQEARESYELSQGRYKAGVCDAIELKEAQISYENAKLAYISNIYEYNSAKAALEMAIGQSIKPSEVQENVEI